MTVNVGVSEGAGDGDVVTVSVKVGVGGGWVPLEVIKAEIRPRLKQMSFLIKGHSAWTVIWLQGHFPL